MRRVSLNSRRKLKAMDAARFVDMDPPLFAELAAVVCRAGVIPQKELHECWQMACRVHQAFSESLHVVDIAAGHGLLAWILVLLARTSETPIARTAVAVDIKRPKSADALTRVMTLHWPSLADTVHYVEGSIDAVIVADGPRPLFVAAHACGSLSDRVLIAAITSRSAVAIMPCCHSFRKQGQSLASLASLTGLSPPSIDSVVVSASGPSAAIDQLRIDALAAVGYAISEDSIDPKITTFHRIILGQPPAARDEILNPRAASSVRPDLLCGRDGAWKRSGEVHAYERVQAFNVSSIHEARTLSQRPSREWLRTFDLSFWVQDEAMGERLAGALDGLTTRIMAGAIVLADVECSAAQTAKDASALRAYLFPDDADGGAEASLDSCPVIDTHITLLDRYFDPETRRLACTYRIEISSSEVSLSKADAGRLRGRLCRAASELSSQGQAGFAWRGG